MLGVRKDEDLSAMYLSAKKVNEPRDTHDHEELELLLESFSKQVEEIMSEVDTIVVSLSISALYAHRKLGMMIYRYSAFADSQTRNQHKRSQN